MGRPDGLADLALPASAPRYELRVRPHAADTEYAIWQLPAPATPHLSAPVRIAGLRGRNLDLIEHRVLRRLARVRVRPRPSPNRKRQRYALREDTALTLGLLFRALAPMRSRDNMRAVAEGVEAMEREEAAYWLGMAMHRRRPRRVLTALRVLLTERPRRDNRPRRITRAHPVPGRRPQHPMLQRVSLLASSRGRFWMSQPLKTRTFGAAAQMPPFHLPESPQRAPSRKAYLSTPCALDELSHFPPRPPLRRQVPESTPRHRLLAHWRCESKTRTAVDVSPSAFSEPLHR